MDNTTFNSFDNIAVKEIAPGFLSKLIHTDNNTINFIAVKAGCSVPLHSHVHQQMSFVIEGIFEMTVEDVTKKPTNDIYVVIPPNAEHGGRAITDCKLIDIFNQARKDYKLL